MKSIIYHVLKKSHLSMGELRTLALYFTLATLLISPSLIQNVSPQQEGNNWAVENFDSHATNFNPQQVLTKDNAHALELKWVKSFPLAPRTVGGYTVAGSELSAPLVIDGIMYLGTSYGQILALDTVNGKTKWVYTMKLNRTEDARKRLPIIPDPPINHIHSITYFEGKLFFPAPPCDIHIVSASDGHLISTIPNICDVRQNDGNGGLYRGPPSYGPSVHTKERVLVVAAGSVIEQNTGGRGFVAGYDIDTLERLWKFFILPPAGGDPEWTLKVAEKGWIAGIKASTLPREVLLNDWGEAGAKGSQSGAARGQWAIDEETGIVYIGTAQPSPAGNATFRPGPNVFSASVVALKARTGELVWWHQAFPHDLVGWDCNWNTILGKFVENGREKKAVYKFCENGTMYAFDAADGRMLWSFDPPSTKKCPACLTKDPRNPDEMTKPWATYPSRDSIFRNPPSGFGLENDIAMAYGMIYVSTYNFWDVVQIVPVEQKGPYTAGYAGLPDPYLRANTTIYALDAATGKPRWSFLIPSVGYRVSLVVSGGMVILTAPNGVLYALDAMTGSIVWQKFFGAAFLENAVIASDSKGKMNLFLASGGLVKDWASGLPRVVPGLVIALGLPDNPSAVPKGFEPIGTKTSQGGKLAPILSNAPQFKCRSWMDDATCKALTQSCGNGICDVNEKCSTCAFDCGCGGAQVCNPENGVCHSPAGVCSAPRGEG